MPLKNPKAKGSKNERRSKKLLEKEGYLICKAGGSLGAFDLFCIGPSDVLLVQVKSNKKPRPAEMEEMRSIPTGPFVEKLVHVWKDYAREPRVIYLDKKLEKELNPLKSCQCRDTAGGGKHHIPGCTWD